MKNSFKFPLLAKIIFAIVLGFLSSYFFPIWLSKIFITFNSLFENYLNFVIPLIILGLVAPGISDLGRGAGKLLLLTVVIAYVSTLLAGYFSYSVCGYIFPKILQSDPNFASLDIVESSKDLGPYFKIEMPPLFGVMSALIFAFILGLGATSLKTNYLKDLLKEFGEVVLKVINRTIIPLLPLFIFGIFLKLSLDGQIATIFNLFLKVIVVIFAIHIVWLVVQFAIAGIITKKNPFKALVNMLPAYFTALGTQSSAATIPVTLKQTIKNGVDPEVASFTVPLCATIHLSGSMLKIVACSFAIMYMLSIPTPVGLYTSFMLMLAITMVAAPGVPGGAIMAALGVLSSVLGFDSTMNALMIALYITMDSFGTACNVTGDGAISMIVNKIKSSPSLRYR